MRNEKEWSEKDNKLTEAINKHKKIDKSSKKLEDILSRLEVIEEILNLS